MGECRNWHDTARAGKAWGHSSQPYITPGSVRSTHQTHWAPKYQPAHRHSAPRPVSLAHACRCCRPPGPLGCRQCHREPGTPAWHRRRRPRTASHRIRSSRGATRRPAGRPAACPGRLRRSCPPLQQRGRRGPGARAARRPRRLPRWTRPGPTHSRLLGQIERRRLLGQRGRGWLILDGLLCFRPSSCQ
jgi:hypothetical protein